MLDHVCTLKVDNDKKLSFRDRWSSIIQISRKTPRAKKYFDSMALFTNEKQRHSTFKYWWIIHPFSNCRFFWDLIMTVVYIISFISIPFSVCFIIMSHDDIGLDKFNLLIYGFCWIDIIMNCFTGYYDKYEMGVELRPLKIFIHYLKTFLIFDILSSLPWDHITLPWRKLPGHNSSFIVSLINIFPCLKLIRYGYIDSQIFELFIHFEVKHYAMNLLTFHFTKTNVKMCLDCWMVKLENNSKVFRFRCALFIVVDQISASGYGHLVPYTDDHIILNCILLLVGRILEFYIAVMIIRIRMGMKESTSKFQEIINQLLAYVNQKQLPKHIKIRLVAYYYHRFRKNYFREKTIMLTISEHLRQEIALESCHRLVENVSMFRNLPKNILRNIVKNLKFELYLPNDVIVKAGAHGDCMFFLSAGTVAVLTPTGKEICHLDDGAHFGEIALLVPDQRRVASVIAIEVCEVYRLNRKDFRKCIAVHSELFATIESIATERIERAVVIEEQHKRYLMRDTSRVEDKSDMPHL
ncbi:potassium/sodium hyperpolarization-activated cyclic nucleotide-gated channel 1-like [Apis mellifera carnica]|nr:potassium/sodium hyperpolarization-activated cyclic nucleotide-gated channel 1-like [Apis mellifera carnica]